MDEYRKIFEIYFSRTRLAQGQPVSQAAADSSRRRQLRLLKEDKKQLAVRGRSFKIQLQQAGQGRKKICFNSKTNATDVMTKQEESYLKLIAGGGFEILQRGQGPFALSIIPPPNSGYTVHF